MDYGDTSLSVASFTLGVPSSGFSDRLRMRLSQRCSWVTIAIQDIFRLSPNILTASVSGSRVLKPLFMHLCISLLMNTEI